jgi:hypothetical protein
LLLERRLLTVEQLEEALEQQQREGTLLGEILVARGWVGEDEMLRAVGTQCALPVVVIELEKVAEEVITLLPPSLAFRHNAFPVGIAADGTLEIASDRILPAETIAEIAAAIGRPVKPVLTAAADLRRAMRHGYPGGLAAAE